jgi:hypothetical protein
LLTRLLGRAGAAVLRPWVGSLRFAYHPVGPDVDPRRPDLAGRYIYAMWHEYLLLPIAVFARPDIHVLISRSADGQLVTETCRRLDIPVVRGSTSRGGSDAVRRLVRAGAGNHLALTPDGPRGPRQRVQPGAIYLAARTGLPIVPVGFGLDRPCRANSWDAFALPRPWSRARCVTSEPIAVPADADANALEAYRSHLEESLTYATGLAEDWALSGTALPPDRVAPAVPQRLNGATVQLAAS